MRWSLAAVMAVCVALGCEADGQRVSRAVPGAPAHTAGAVQQDSTYRVVPVPEGGRIAGRVLLHGRVRRDSVIAAMPDTGACRAARRVTLVEGSADRVAGAVVWLEGIRAGKPLPSLRRYDLATRHCEARPMTQAAIAGGMLDVQNLDPVAHRTRFTMAGATLDVVDQSDAGQVVPTAAVIAHRGLVAVRCDVHPGTRAWIRVFDHPYFTVTTREGSFTIDSVPPGTYRLAVWQPSLGERDTTIHIAARQSANATVTFTAAP